MWIFRRRKVCLFTAVVFVPLPSVGLAAVFGGRQVAAPTAKNQTQRPIMREAHIICTASVMPKAHHVLALRNTSFPFSSHQSLLYAEIGKGATNKNNTVGADTIRPQKSAGKSTPGKRR